MIRSFSLVDHKVEETEFFLRKLTACDRNMFELRCYVSAFVASARSVTFALQAVLKHDDEFAAWYAERQTELRDNKLARFFLEFRNVNQHIGENVANAGYGGANGKLFHLFTPTQDVPNVPDEDVVTACHKHFVTVLNLVFNCYADLGSKIDGKQRYTEANAASLGITIEDAEAEMGFPAGWTDINDPDALPHRWQALRDETVGCEINPIFHNYLGKTTPVPDRLPPLSKNGT